jgi:hypothetical protein
MSRRKTPEGQSPSSSLSWRDFIAPFAQAIGVTPEDVDSKLKNLLGDPTDSNIDLLQNEEFTPFADLQAAFSDVPVAKLRHAVATVLRKKPEVATAPSPEEPATSLNQTPVFGQVAAANLPTAPDDDAWLAMLKASGELKVDQACVVSGVRSVLAARTGLYGIPKKLVTLMEQQAEQLAEPVTAEYLSIRKQLTSRSYAEVFEALGVEGTFATADKKQKLLRRLDEKLFPSLYSFYQSLQGWSEAWMQGATNPGAMTMMLAAALGGSRTGAVLPPGMMQPPATEVVRGAAENAIDQINQSFGGTGVITVRALAYDALKVKEALSNPALPSQIGAINREQMLKTLGVQVTSDYVVLERNLVTFILGILEVPKLTADSELGYLTSLLTVGSQIPWDRISSPANLRAIESVIEES